MTNPRCFFLAGCLAFATIGCENDRAKITALSSAVNTAEDKATGVTLLYSRGAVVEARLTAVEFIRAGSARPPYTEARKGVKIEFFDENAQIKSTLTADYARWYEAQNNVLIRRNVVIVDREGKRLKTEELVWNQSAQKFFSEKFVTIQTATQTLYGDGLEANQDFSNYQIKNLRGKVLVDKSAVPTD